MTASAHEREGGPPIDIVVQSVAWAAEPGAEAIVRRAIAAAAALARAATGEVSVLLADDAAVRRLNRDWRKIDRPTNVLSFPAPVLPLAAAGKGAGGGDRKRGVAHAPLGDIVIAYETAAREAAAEAKPFPHHLAHLAVHGFLHLLGYNHDSDAEADEMERLEAGILARLDVPDPYAAQAATA